MKAEKWLGLIALTAALFTFLAVVASFNAKPALIKDNLAYVIVIDAGHGGIDGGVTGVNTNVKESEINLLIAKELKEIFEINGFTALLTRSDDNGLYGDTSPGFKKRDMEARKKIILESGADLVVSIHQNSYRASYRRGAQVFYQKGSSTGEAFAATMQSMLNSRLGTDLGFLAGDYYICRCSEIPTVIVECGFLSNPQDEALLLTRDYRKKMAEYIMQGCIAYLFGERENAA
jgi:N-acetylmuramoyl-L-alanine amidase